jgi:predicted RNA-binding Zn ribbon-like protein
MVAEAADDPRPLPGEPPALDLLNTQWLASGQPVDLLATAGGTVAWLAAAGAAAGPAAGAAAAARQPLVQARQAICDVLAALNEPGGQPAVPATGHPTAPASGQATDRLNAVLAHGRLRLSIGPDRTASRELAVDDPAWRPAVLAAANLLDLLAATPGRIRRCQHPACVLWFLDTTRNGTRRWCSMASCGNRVKARRHYERARSSGESHPPG